MNSEVFVVSGWIAFSLASFCFALAYIHNSKVNLFVGLHWFLNSIYILMEWRGLPLQIVYLANLGQLLCLVPATRELPSPAVIPRTKRLLFPVFLIAAVLTAVPLFAPADLLSATIFADQKVQVLPAVALSAGLMVLFGISVIRLHGASAFIFLIRNAPPPSPNEAFRAPRPDQELPKLRANVERLSTLGKLTAGSSFVVFGLLQFSYPLAISEVATTRDLAFVIGILPKIAFGMGIAFLLKANARQNEIELRRLARMQEYGFVIASVHHELRQPQELLSAVLVGLKAGNMDEESLRRLRKDLRRGIERSSTALDLIRIMRETASDYSQGTAPLCDVNGVLADALRFARDRTRAGGQVQFEMALLSGLPYVIGRPPRLVNAIANVLVNAIEAARGAPERKAMVRVTTRVDAGAEAVEIAIRDSGAGISNEDLPHIFEPTFSKKRDEDGDATHGMGLYVTRRILELHGGSVSVESSDDGSEFLLRLPVGKERSKGGGKAQ